MYQMVILAGVKIPAHPEWDGAVCWFRVALETGHSEKIYIPAQPHRVSIAEEIIKLADSGELVDLEVEVVDWALGARTGTKMYLKEIKES